METPHKGHKVHIRGTGTLGGVGPPVVVKYHVKVYLHDYPSAVTAGLLRHCLA